MKKNYLFVIIILWLTGCNLSKDITVNNYNTTFELPGTIRINDTLFCDFNEIDNISWVEYYNWNLSIFGDTSIVMIECAPYNYNSSDLTPCNINYKNNLWRLVLNKYASIIGISQEQAKNYSKWRSDRVFEKLLIDLNKIKYNPNQNPSNYFTIERYFSGELDSFLIGEKLYIYPCYSLPTFNERKLIVQFSDSLNQLYFKEYGVKTYSDFLTYHPHILCNVNPCINDTFVYPMKTYYQFLNNIKPIMYHLNGNVSEWANEVNYHFGGSWKDSYEKILEVDTFYSTTFSNDIGFRNVCKWVKWETK